jgi:hypothetical protein
MNCPRCKAQNAFGYKHDVSREDGFIIEGYWNCIACGHRVYDAMRVDPSAVTFQLDGLEGQNTNVAA